MPEEQLVNELIAGLYAEYEAAQSSKALWAAQEKRLKTRLLLALGYDPFDSKPPPMTAVNSRGESLFEVAVSYRKSIDIPYLKEKYPAIYAECEKTVPAKSIKPAE